MQVNTRVMGVFAFVFVYAHVCMRAHPCARLCPQISIDK